jgi:hypothetical protein
MPPYPPSFAVLSTALRDSLGLVGVLDEAEAKRGLASGRLLVIGTTPSA